MARITHGQLKKLAAAAGYEEARDYAMDCSLVRCYKCGRWGELGDEMVLGPEERGNGDDNWQCAGGCRRA